MPPSGPSTACDPRAAHLEFIGARGAASAASASPLNAVDVRVVGSLLLQRREAHPFHPRPGPPPAKPVPLRQSGLSADATRWALMGSATPGNPNSAKPRDSCFTSEGRKPEGNGETRAVGLLLFLHLLLLHPDRLNPSRGVGAPWPVLLPPFPVAFHPAKTARSWTSISRGAKEGNARPWGCARSRAAMSWSLEDLPSSCSSF